MPRRPSPALAISLLALFVSLGGSSYAALKIGSRQIADNSIRSRDVRNGGLLARDFKPGQLPRGEQGKQGPPGPLGPVAFANLTRVEQHATVPAGERLFVTATCPTGMNVVTGGYAMGFTTTAGSPSVYFNDAFGDPDHHDNWHVGFDNRASATNESVAVMAYCIPSG